MQMSYEVKATTKENTIIVKILKKFQKPHISDAQNLNVPALQSTFPSYSFARSGEDMPTIRATDYSGYNQFPPQLLPTSSYLFQEHIDRPTYFTPSPGLSFFLSSKDKSQ